jgi:MFS family permease
MSSTEYAAPSDGDAPFDPLAALAGGGAAGDDEHRPQAAGAHPARVGLLTSAAVVVAPTFMALLDVFVVNVAAPSIQRNLHASNGQLQLIIGSYILTYTSLVVVGGRSGDRFGRKRVFIGGVGLFSVASLACGISPTADMLILARAVQGVGSAFMVPQVLAIIHTSFAESQRQRVLGVYGAATGLGSVAGLVLGGFLLAADPLSLGWRSVFLINVPVGAVTVMAARRLIKASPGITSAKIDGAAALLLGTALVLVTLTLVLDGGAGSGAWRFVALAAAGVFAAALVAWERRVRRRGAEPLIPTRALRRPSFLYGTALILATQASLAAFLLLFALHFEGAASVSPLAVGGMLVGPAVGYGITSLATDWALSILGRAMIPIGLAALVSGYAGMALVLRQEGASAELVLAPMMLASVGMGLVFTPAVHIAMAGLQDDEVGSGSGVMTTVMLVADLIGVAGFGALFFAVRSATTGSFLRRSAVGFSDVAFVLAVGLSVLLVGSLVFNTLGQIHVDSDPEHVGVA